MVGISQDFSLRRSCNVTCIPSELVRKRTWKKLFEFKFDNNKQVLLYMPRTKKIADSNLSAESAVLFAPKKQPSGKLPKGRPIDPNSERQKKLRNHVPGRPRGRPVVPGSARQKLLKERAAHPPEPRGRPINPNSERQKLLKMKLAERTIETKVQTKRNLRSWKSWLKIFSCSSIHLVCIACILDCLRKRVFHFCSYEKIPVYS